MVFYDMHFCPVNRILGNDYVTHSMSIVTLDIYGIIKNIIFFTKKKHKKTGFDYLYIKI